MNKNNLFISCVNKIKRYPSLNACSFPVLPKDCYFVIAPPCDNRYKIECDGRIFTYEDYRKEKYR